MKTKRYFKTMLLTMAVSGLCLQTLAGAQDTSQTQPAYSSAVKAGQAAQVAKQEAMTTNPSLQAALTHVEKAEYQMGQLQMSDDQHQRMSAEMALNNAEDKYVGMLSKMSGVSEKDISDMHTAGVGWADVPSELGMHGMIGQKMNSRNGNMGNGQGSMNTGSMMGSRKSEVMGATARDTQSGMVEGHGADMQTDVHGSGGMASGAGGLGNGMSSGEMGDHDNGMSGSMSGGMGGGSGSGGGHGSGGGSGSGGGGMH